MLALLSAFVLSLMQKWKVLEWLQVHANEFFYKMFTCRFCMSFWVAMIICIFVAVITGKWIVLLAPMFSCNLTKWIW